MSDIVENVKPFPTMRTDESTVVTGADAKRINTHCQNIQDEITRLRDALEKIAAQKTTEDMTVYEYRDGDFEYGYDRIIEIARDTLAKHKG